MRVNPRLLAHFELGAVTITVGGQHVIMFDRHAVIRVGWSLRRNGSVDADKANQLFPEMAGLPHTFDDVIQHFIERLASRQRVRGEHRLVECPCRDLRVRHFKLSTDWGHRDPMSDLENGLCVFAKRVEVDGLDEEQAAFLFLELVGTGIPHYNEMFPAFLNIPLDGALPSMSQGVLSQSDILHRAGAPT